MRARLLLPFLLAFFGTHTAIAQIIGTNCFLQGRYLEVGMCSNAAFGSCAAPPAGYHPHLSGTGIPPAGNNLSSVYDYGHDGWTVGTPPYMGDYTYPGSPFEGWELQIGTGRSQAFLTFCPAATTNVGGMTLTGAWSSYSNVGGRAIGTWQGTATYTGGVTLAVTQETRVDTMASWVVITTKFRNTSAAPAPNVYYLRSCDPDNDETFSFNFSTNNTVVWQDFGPGHKTLVKSLGTVHGPNSYMALGAKDCRARCFIYSSWSIGSGVDLAGVWSGTGTGLGTSTFTPGNSQNGDVGIGIVFNIGTIAAGDSAAISYAYIYKDDASIDSTFPDPQIVVNGLPKPVTPIPFPNYDTIDLCNSGITVLPVELLNADDKNWTWGHWTWAPATGLASTTGVTNTITTGTLPPVITYTITGTDSASGMKSCMNKVFYLTIHSCNGATSNSPCVGDTIFFNAPGDSSAASYAWYGPNAFGVTPLATTQKWEKIPALLSDTGWYYVIKTVAGIPDTSRTHVVVHPLPTPTVTSNQGNCAPIVGALTLTAATTEPMGTYAWSGPNGFASTATSPTISPFDSAGAGTYSVSLVSTFGCKASGVVNVRPGAVADFTADIHPGCAGDTVILTNTSFNANAFTWKFPDGSPDITMTTMYPQITHVFTAHATHIVTLNVSNAFCSATKTLPINTFHSVTAAFTAQDLVCLTLYTDSGPTTDPLAPTNTSSAIDETTTPTSGSIVSTTWSFGDGSADVTVPGTGVPDPQHTYTAAGTYLLTITVTDAIGCEAVDTETVQVVQPALRGVTDTTFCLTTQAAELENWISIYPAIDSDAYGATYLYAWSGDGTQYLDNDSLRSPYWFGPAGDYTLTLTALLEPYHCMATHQTVVHARLPMPLSGVTLGSTITLGESVQLNASGVLYYSWTPTDGSLNDPNISNPVATPTVTTTYTVYGFDIYGCRDTATVTIMVDSTMTEFTPSAFTPNGDNLNDVFRARLGKNQKLVEFRVFNRWGEQLFVSNDIEAGWDGKYHGVPQDMGVYYYQIIAARPGHPDNVVYRGEVTLIR